MSNSAFAQKKYKNTFNSCIPSKPVINNYEPAEFHKNNNLLRGAGESESYHDDIITLRGKVLDVNCVPIADAKIYLWQAGNDGRYPYRPLRDIVDTSKISLHPKSTFRGSGIATSNNKGEFHFITIRPKNHHINIRVEHLDLGLLQTSLYIPKGKGCDCENTTHTSNYNFEIVMNIANLHKRY